jgi:hypothetical protein
VNAEKKVDEAIFEKLRMAKANNNLDIKFTKTEIDRLFQAFTTVKKNTLVFGKMQRVQRNWIL